MTLGDQIKNQLRTIIQWESPHPAEIFYRFTDKGDELKNASKLVLQPGQGAVFTHEGKIVGVFDQEGIYDIKTANIPFLSTLKSVMSSFESQHKVGLWFYRKADIVNVRWGTRMPITYNDPVYGFPVNLRGFGNFSIRIVEPVEFFTRIVAGRDCFGQSELQELLLSRVMQPIGTYLATARFSYAEIASHMNEIADAAKNVTENVFAGLGFSLLDFRIESTSFDEETQKRIAEISDVQADAKAAQLVGVDFAELQRLKALRDAAKNPGAGGAAVGMM